VKWIIGDRRAVWVLDECWVNSTAIHWCPTYLHKDCEYEGTAVSTFISESRRWDKDPSPLLLLWAEVEGEDKLDIALIGALQSPCGMGETALIRW